MIRERVVITGAGAVSPFGVGVDALWSSLLAGDCGLRSMPGRESVEGLGAAVAGIAPELDVRAIPRQHRRSMSRMALLAHRAAVEALAGWPGYPTTIGLSLGGTMGSPDTLVEFFTEYLGHKSLATVRSTAFFKVMGHGMASSLALALGLTGRALAPSCACATGLTAVGLGFECIAAGRADAMLCGGAEEFNPLTAATFDHILAASHNPDPASASRPFDTRRDGLVCGEGAGILLLESLSGARRRSAPILAEILGFATNISPKSIIHPDAGAIGECMSMALSDAGLAPGDIGGVNAHATATVEGDRAEAEALGKLFGNRTPVNSLKSQLGHCMAASGGLELIACLRMMREGVFLPNRNLEEIDPGCAGIGLPTRPVATAIPAMLKNSFALGGVNASLVVGAYDGAT